MSYRLNFVALLALVGTTAACTASSDAETSNATEDELRRLKPKEFVGFLQYGDEVVASYTPSSTYQAYRFRANAYDPIEVTLTAETPGTAVWATILDDEGNELTPGTNSGEPTRTLNYTMPGVFAQRTIVFREAALKKTNVRIKLTSPGIREPAVAFGGKAGTYAAPAAFAAEVQDVPLRCLKTKDPHDTYQVSRSESAGLVSLDLSGGTPKVVGADGALGAPDGIPANGVAAAALSTVQGAEFANAIAMGGVARRSYKHLLQLTNVGNEQVRVEYALEWANYAGDQMWLSCVGTLKK
ncbi:MAG TPA: hypothetical protein VM925_10970 [Labilithrix sp.]|nr:hypothetical protein [Labilithrix sp.]